MRQKKYELFTRVITIVKDTAADRDAEVTAAIANLKDNETAVEISKFESGSLHGYKYIGNVRYFRLADIA